MKHSKLWTALISAGVVMTVAGCGTFDILETKKIDYKSAGKVPSLEIPPDLTSPATDSRYQVPDLNPRGSATYSAYSSERGDSPRAATQILPAQEQVRIERAGTQRWLVVNQPPEKVWPMIKEFWQENGFLINLEQPDTGIMETDWAENRAKIPQDIIRRTLGKVLDGLYSTAERDKFRTRIERSTATGETEIYISHRGMIEVYDGSDSRRTVWQPRPADPELEAEMLKRLMARLGVEKERAQALLAAQGQPDRARIVKAADGSSVLAVAEPFDRAWRRVGLALDRVGFTVEDRDRARGIYFVRYVDPAKDVETKKDKGFLDKLVFWRSDKKSGTEQFQIEVSENQAATGSDVRVMSAKGAAPQPETAGKIVKLLYEQLK